MLSTMKIFLCIDQLELIGEKLGKHLANMINIFNPELVVIGGTLDGRGVPYPADSSRPSKNILSNW